LAGRNKHPTLRKIYQCADALGAGDVYRYDGTQYTGPIGTGDLAIVVLSDAGLDTYQTETLGVMPQPLDDAYNAALEGAFAQALRAPGEVESVEEEEGALKNI